MSASTVSQFEVIVIGGGPGGYSAAIRLAQSGLRTACVEAEAVGGVCLNWGCIPSKALISVGQRYQAALTGARMGVRADSVHLDMVQAQVHNRSVVHHHTEGVAGLLKSNGVELVYGTARLESSRRVRVRHADGTSRVFEATRGLVIATGATPRVLPGFAPDGERILSAKEAVFLERVPEHLVVLGGGVIGLELGSAYHALGSRLTVVEASDQLLPGIDPDLTQVVKKQLSAGGAQFFLSTQATAWEPTTSGVRVQLQAHQGALSIEGTSVLVAAGFVPRSDALGLTEVGVELDARGHIRTTDDCQTTAAGVYAIGDIAGPPYLAHKAFAEAQVVFDALTGHRAKRDWRALPGAVFTEPEIATVGLSETAAKAQGLDVTIGRFPFSASGRAMARGQTHGFVKLIAVNERVVGAGIVGADASELISELTLAIEVGASLEDLALTIHPHPTLSEAIHDAAEHGLGHAVHVLNRARKPGAMRV
jgi:dihydrolipoamide dehydrogenase